MSQYKSNWRTFLKPSAVATTIASQLAAIAPAQAERIRIGIIGPGRRGFGSHVKSLIKLRNSHGVNLDITALNDVYSVHRDQDVNYIKKETNLTSKTEADYRDLLNDIEMGKYSK